MKALVGYTGFVGSNLAASTGFEGLYNSANIASAYGTAPDILVFAGLRAEKYLANTEPEKDYQLVANAFDNIKKTDPKKLVLISTVDVYKAPDGVDEDSPIETEGLHPYGLNRFKLESMVLESGIDTLIVRLPGLFGINLKKNFLYDMIKVIPQMLTAEKIDDLSGRDGRIRDYYQLRDDGFYQCRKLSAEEREFLKGIFLNTGFTAVNFTDSRAVFQFYPLSCLWEHIKIALAHDLTLVNLATAPVSAGEIYRGVRGSEFVNEITANPPKYDFRTKHAELLGGKDGYIFDSGDMLSRVLEFVEGQRA